MPTKYIAPTTLTVTSETQKAEFTRADLRFHDVDHSGTSYEARIFLNNPNADENTATTPDAGYAGSFHIFGHGGCYGSIGHCDVPVSRRKYDLRQPHPLVPVEKHVQITEALTHALKDQGSIHVTIVAIVRPATQDVDSDTVLKFKSLDLVTYLSPEPSST